MPLPFLIGGIALAGAALFGSAARDVNEQWESQLNSINDEMERMQSDANTLVKNTKSNFEDSVKRLANIQNRIGQQTLYDFSTMAEKIKANTNYNFNYIGYTNFDFIKDYQITFSNNSTYGSLINTTYVDAPVLNSVLNISSGLFLGLQAIRGVSLGCKIDDASAERRKLKVQIAKIETQCAEINASTKFIQTVTSTLYTLNRITNNLNISSKALLEKNNYNLRYLSEEEITQIRTMFNYNIALNDIINTKLLTDDGKISDDFRNRFNEKSREIKEI